MSVFFFLLFVLIQKKSKMVHQTQWHPNTWKASPIVQDVVYEDQEGYSNVLTKLAHLPPMVSPREVTIF